MNTQRQKLLKKLAKRFKTMLERDLFAGLHFDLLSKDEVKSEILVKGILEPNLPRVKATKHQAILRKEIWGTAVTLITNLNFEEGEFCKSGSVWVHISPSNSTKPKDRQLSIIFNKVEGVEYKVKVLLKALVLVLKSRPLDSTHAPRILREDKKTGDFYFVSPTKHTDRIPLLHALDLPNTTGISEKEKNVVKQIFSTREKWQKRRKKIEIAEKRVMGRRREIKITWKKVRKK